MYRIIKTLNHNAVLATDMNDNQEYILLGKGIGFGKKVSERIDAPEDVRIYSLKHVSERGKAKDLLQDTPAEYLDADGNPIQLNPGKTWICIVWDEYGSDVVVE